MLAGNINATLIACIAGLILSVALFLLIRIKGGLRTSWAVALFLFYPIVTAIVLLLSTEWNPSASSLQVGGYVAEKTGGFLVISALSLFGLILSNGKPIGMFVVMTVMSLNTWITGNDFLSLDLPNQMPTILSPLILLAGYWLWMWFDGDIFVNQMRTGASNILITAKHGKLLHTSHREIGPRTSDLALRSRTLLEEDAEQRSQKADNSLDLGAASDDRITRLVVGAVVGAVFLVSIIVVASVVSANKFSYLIFANDPTRLIFPAILGAILGAGLTYLRK